MEKEHITHGNFSLDYLWNGISFMDDLGKAFCQNA
jgi:hypothetical protein